MKLIRLFIASLLALASSCVTAIAGQQTNPVAITTSPEPTMRMDMSSMGPMNMDMMMDNQRFKLYGWVETGITVNFDSPEDHQNFGRLLDDRSNEPLLN